MSPLMKSSAPLLYVQQSGTVVAGLTTPPAAATYAMITVETNAIRWRDDGTNPSATVGQPVAVGGSISYDGDLAAFKWIPQTGTAQINVSYYTARRP